MTAAGLLALAPLTAMFSTPIQWLPVLLMLTFWQIFFMRAYSFRLYWNQELKSWRLRPQDFPAFYFQWTRPKPTAVQAPAPIPIPGRYRTRE